MSIDLALLTAVQLAKLANELVKQWQLGQLTDEQFLERWHTQIVPMVRKADLAWEEAGESSP
jgi:hypothetical protein